MKRRTIAVDTDELEEVVFVVNKEGKVDKKRD